MKIEKFKTILLTNLVVLSILLSYNLWTYQDNFSMLESPKAVQNVSLADRREVSDIIKPSQVVYHASGSHFMSGQMADIELVTTIIERGNIEDVKDISNEMSVKAIQNLVTEDGKLEIVYPTPLSLEMLKKIYSIDERKYGDLEINRMIIDIGELGNDSTTIYFVSLKEGRVLQGTLNNISGESLVNVSSSFSSRLPESMKHSLSNNEVLYLPKEPVTLPMLDVLAAYIRKETFENALFSNPDYLKSETEGNIRSYTDGVRLLKINSDTGTLSYLDPSVQPGNEMTGGQLIQRSLDFINGHEGWTNQYFLDSWNEETGEILFRMLEDGLPVFGGGTISGKWGQEKIISYDRSIFRLGDPLRSTESMVTLPSGQEVIEKIENSTEINKENIQDIMIGYKIKEVKGSTSEFADEYIQLIPIWCIKYNSNYYKLNFDSKTGGDMIGLEQN